MDRLSEARASRKDRWRGCVKDMEGVKDDCSEEAREVLRVILKGNVRF